MPTSLCPSALERAFALANRLYLALEERGHRVVIAPQGEHLVRQDIDQREPRPKKEVFSWVEERWAPGRPTVTYVGTVAIGLTVYELSELEEVEFRFRERRYVRLSEIPLSERRKLWGREKPETAYMPCGRLGVHVYSPYLGTQWKRDWREIRARELTAKVEEIAQEIERGAPVIADLVKEERRRREECSPARGRGP